MTSNSLREEELVWFENLEAAAERASVLFRDRFTLASFALISKGDVTKGVRRAKKWNLECEKYGVYDTSSKEATDWMRNTADGAVGAVGVDNNGCSALCLTLSHLLPEKFQSEEDMKMLIKFIVDNIWALTPTLQSVRDGIVVVLNFDDVTWKNFSYNLTVKLISVIQNSFPARINCFYAVDSPATGVAIFHLIKLFLKQKMANRFVFLPKDKLLAHFKADQLSMPLGGTYECDSYEDREASLRNYRMSVQQVEEWYFEYRADRPCAEEVDSTTHGQALSDGSDEWNPMVEPPSHPALCLLTEAEDATPHGHASAADSEEWNPLVEPASHPGLSSASARNCNTTKDSVLHGTAVDSIQDPSNSHTEPASDRDTHSLSANHCEGAIGEHANIVSTDGVMEMGKENDDVVSNEGGKRSEDDSDIISIEEVKKTGEDMNMVSNEFQKEDNLIDSSAGDHGTVQVSHFDSNEGDHGMRQDGNIFSNMGNEGLGEGNCVVSNASEGEDKQGKRGIMMGEDSNIIANEGWGGKREDNDIVSKKGEEEMRKCSSVVAHEGGQGMGENGDMISNVQLQRSVVDASPAIPDAVTDDGVVADEKAGTDGGAVADEKAGTDDSAVADDEALATKQAQEEAANSAEAEKIAAEKKQAEELAAKQAQEEAADLAKAEKIAAEKKQAEELAAKQTQEAEAEKNAAEKKQAEAGDESGTGDEAGTDDESEVFFSATDDEHDDDWDVAEQT